MCTPIGHTLLGYGIARNHSIFKDQKGWLLILAILIFANLPDVDYLFGALSGFPNRYHQTWTHSLVFVLCVSFLTGVGYKTVRHTFSWKVPMIVFLILTSHLVLDMLGNDTRYPYGIQLFWPFSKSHILSPITVFRGINKASENHRFLQALFCWGNLKTVGLEVLILGPVAAWSFIRNRKK